MTVSVVFSCNECGTERPYGQFRRVAEAVVDNKQPALNCKACGKITKHGFVGLASRMSEDGINYLQPLEVSL